MFAQIPGSTRKKWTVKMHIFEPIHYHDYSLLNKINAFVDIIMYVLPPNLRKAEYDKYPLVFFF